MPGDADDLRINIRKATSEDQAAITAMVRRAHLNPRNLHWSRFVVAERDRTIVGIGQVRIYPDGSHELASLVVQPTLRGRGVAAGVIDELLSDDHGDVYTLIDLPFTQRFQRWGFRVIDPGALPRSISRTYRIGRVVTGTAAVVTRRRVRIVPLKRSAGPRR
jgi:N-acetylglutamate synthase-like GNAT family acetyltransferase